MLPSLLVNDIQTALKQFLVSAFEPVDAVHHGLMSGFVDDEAAWPKGPYVQVGLPFVPGKSGWGRAFFEAFETTDPGFSHQERAWERLARHRQGLSTLVATGADNSKSAREAIEGKLGWRTTPQTHPESHNAKTPAQG